jgi:hypothetical protein
MNKYRTSKSIFSRRKQPIRTYLPTQPIPIVIEPWWLINVGCIIDDDVKLLSKVEKDIIDKLIDQKDSNKPTEAGEIEYDYVHALFQKGLIYLDVPLTQTDYAEVPPLEGFVMNRTVGDYFETLLYKLFVSIDDRISLAELAAILEIDIDLVINAVSLYCRLAFAKKVIKNSDENIKEYDVSWKDWKNKKINNPAKVSGRDSGAGETLLEWGQMSSTVKFINETNSTEEVSATTTDNQFITPLPIDITLKPTVTNSFNLNSPSSTQNNNKRIGFLFDST